VAPAAKDRGDYFCTGARIRKTDVRPALGKSARGLRLEWEGIPLRMGSFSVGRK